MLEPTECRAISPDIYIVEYKRTKPTKKRRRLRKEAITQVLTWAVLAITGGMLGWMAIDLLLGR